MQVRQEIFRGVWEGRCSIEACEATCRLTGSWKRFVQTPQSFLSLRPEKYPGWLMVHRHHLTHDIESPQLLLCPEHRSLWEEYEARVHAWDQEQRTKRKSWLYQAMRAFHPSQPPDSPFDK